MGISGELWRDPSTMPEPCHDDQWVMEVARALRAKYDRKQRRYARIAAALRETHDERDGEAVYV